MVHEADLLAAALALRDDRQFRPRHHLPDADRPNPDVPDRPEAVQVDGGDAGAPAEDEGAPGAPQGGQAAPSAGDAEAVSGGKGEPDGRVPSDPDPDPDLLRPLQGADGVGGDAPQTLRLVDQGSVGARSAHADQPVRLPALHS